MNTPTKSDVNRAWWDGLDAGLYLAAAFVVLALLAGLGTARLLARYGQ